MATEWQFCQPLWSLAASSFSPGTYVYIYSVVASPTISEEVRLKNPTDTSVDLAGWTLGNLGNPTAYTFPNGSIIHSDSYRTCTGAFLGFEIKDSGDLIFLKNASGSTVDTWYTH